MPLTDQYMEISAYLPDGTEFSCGQILLVNCDRPGPLVSTHFGLYAMTSEEDHGPR